MKPLAAIKVPLFDTDNYLRAQVERVAAVIADLTAQATRREQQRQGTGTLRRHREGGPHLH